MLHAVRCLLLFWIYTPLLLLSQSVKIESIKIEGNKHTKNSVILREMTIQAYDTIPKFLVSAVLKRNQQNIYNLGLFNNVTLIPEWQKDSTLMQLVVHVKERWYIFPAGNVVLEERNSRDVLDKLLDKETRLKVLDRLSVSGSLYWQNMTGHNETLWFLAQLGFSKQFYLYYGYPWLFPKQKIDGYAGLKYIEQKELIYGTQNGKVQWGKVHHEPLRTTIGGYFGIRKRFDLFHSVTVRASYSYYRVADSMKYFNPVYSTNVQKIDHYPSLSIEYVHDIRDIKVYPSKGHRFRAMERIYGFFPNSTASFTKVGLTWAHFIPLSKRWNFAYGSENALIVGQRVPFFEKVFIWLDADDFNDFSPQLRGYESYAIGGSFMTLNKAELRFAVLPRRIIHLKFIPLKRFQDLPIGIYMTGFCDTAYLYDYTTSNQDQYLTNRLLYGYGTGLNVLGFYDSVMRLELSRNHFGKVAINIHATIAIK